MCMWCQLQRWWLSPDLDQLMWRPRPLDRINSRTACLLSLARSRSHAHPVTRMCCASFPPPANSQSRVSPSSFGGVKDPRGILCRTWGKKEEEEGKRRGGRHEGLSNNANARAPWHLADRRDGWMWIRRTKSFVLGLHTLILLPASGPRSHMHACTQTQ